MGFLRILQEKTAKLPGFGSLFGQKPLKMGPIFAKMTPKSGYEFCGVSRTLPSNPNLSTPLPGPKHPLRKFSANVAVWEPILSTIIGTSRKIGVRIHLIPEFVNSGITAVFPRY